MSKLDEIPKQSQLLLPLLESIADMGGAARPSDLYDEVANRLRVDEETRGKIEGVGTQKVNLFQRQVRWARQTAVQKGLLASPKRGIWELTPKGEDTLGNVEPGIVLTVFETAQGTALWAMAEDAAGALSDNCVDLLFTSPPYPILRGKAYGTWDSQSWLSWMTDLAEEWKRSLAPSGSMMVNLGTVWQPGQPTADPYIERFILKMIDDLGFYLADRLYWHNPTKMASPMPWVAIKRVRVKQSIEPILWFSKSPNPKADNRRVLVPYKPNTVKKYIGQPGEAVERPSGYGLGANSFSKDNGGAIPPSLISVANSGSQTKYRRLCRQKGMPIHPATFPEALPEFAIKLTTDPGDLVYDPFLGSGTTAAVAERLGRRWVGSERSLTYLKGAALRLEVA